MAKAKTRKGYASNPHDKTSPLTLDKDEAVAAPQEQEPRVFELKRFGPNTLPLRAT